MSEVKPVNATMEWDGEQQFTGFAGKHEIGFDGRAEAAPTPIQMLALSLMGCMSIDLVHILTRGRHKLTSLKTLFHGERSNVDPKRFTKLRVEFDVTGDLLPEHVERAIDLSREKYCSVWASFHPDTQLIVSFTIKK